ncbi:hypothetical protein LTR37_006771 [Vermiconidia calcicola]|uniref:Uncharacterized protein n=1 Tax=Vermiconidia calcicola TaxID=1690605 RepID=A0ACC3NFZ8_9PEZI|nr:hypothetical protein LTR37_006771 [Vermiconidia calcicola]
MDTSSTVTLNRLLSRLDSTLLASTDSEQLQRLRGSQYERNKVGANIEHARTLLLTLERQASTVKVQTQRQQIQADLQGKREVVKRLNARLTELNQSGDEEDDEEDSDEDGSEEEQVRTASYAPARSDAQDGLNTGGDEPPAPNPQQFPQQQPELRSRNPQLQASDNRSAASTTSREQLFADRNPTNLPQNETLLSHNRSEQETLTTGLLGLARALKESSLQFSSSLETEKDVLKRAEGGLDKSAQGMEAAERKMSMLRRMSEGQGWLGRLKLYGFIFGLWIVCFLVVFIGPKLRL